MNKYSRSLPTSESEYPLLSRFLIIAVVVHLGLFWLLPPYVHGQDELPSAAELSTQCAPEVEEGRRALVTYEGVDGFWFQGDVARCLLRRYSILPALAMRVEYFEARRRVQEARDALQERRVVLAEQETEEATGALEAAVRGQREAEESLNAWHRSRALWFAVGAVVVVIIQVVAVWAYSQLKLP